MSMKVEFFLFRHGETDWNKYGKLQGSADIPLNSTGLKQAEALREFFDSFRREQSFAVEQDLVSSDLSRALHTATIAFRLEGNGPVRRDPRFRETHLGRAEGLTRDELVEKFGVEIWNQWVGLGHSTWSARFPDGESKGEVRDRATSALFSLAGETVSQPGPGVRRVAVSTHGGLIRRLLHSLLPDEPTPIEVVNGAVFQFTIENGILRGQRQPIFKPT